MGVVFCKSDESPLKPGTAPQINTSQGNINYWSGDWMAPLHGGWFPLWNGFPLALHSSTARNYLTRLCRSRSHLFCTPVKGTMLSHFFKDAFAPHTVLFELVPQPKLARNIICCMFSRAPMCPRLFQGRARGAPCFSLLLSKALPSKPGVSMTLKKWVNAPIILGNDHFLRVMATLGSPVLLSLFSFFEAHHQGSELTLPSGSFASRLEAP